MAQARTMNTKQRKLTPWQNFTSNGRFNNGLPPTRRHLQHYVISNAVLLPTKKNSRISSSTSSINNIRINQGTDIHIDLRTPSNLYPESQVEKVLSPFSEVENTNDSISLSVHSIHSQRRRSLHLIENTRELTRECAICLLDQPLNDFEECYSNECEHFHRTICDTCIYQNIKYLLENVINIDINCPEPNCPAIFYFETIRSVLIMRNNLQLFERYDRQLTHQHLEQIQDFVWCAYNGCGSGQLHDMGVHSNPMVTCVKCKKRTCAFHRIKWHVGLTCEEYDQMKRLSIDDNTQIWLRKHSKNCPQCHSYIQKISGCDHMTCKRCKYQFCWECFADYRKIQIYGLRQHMKDCSHHPTYHRSNNTLYTQRSTNCNIL